MRYSRRGGTFSRVARSPATRQRNPDIATRGAPGPKQMTWTACATRCAPSGRSAGSWRHIGWEEFWTALQKKKAVLQNQRPNWACMENTMRKATWSAGWRSECSWKVCSATPKRSAEISTSLRKVSLRLCAVAGRSLSLRMCFRATCRLQQQSSRGLILRKRHQILLSDCVAASPRPSPTLCSWRTRR